MPYEILVALVALAIVFLIFRYGVKAITVYEFEKGLLYKNGKFQRILEPGRYWLWVFWSAVTRVDVRPQFVTLQGQEVLSSDGVTLRVSLAAKYQITDPHAAINKIQNYQTALYLELQMALREIVGSSKIDEVLQNRPAIGQRLMELTAEKAKELGLSLISVDVKDIMFPGELKKIFAQVVRAQKEGQAVLERARGETAALRSLANAAKMIENNPALVQLRLLQVVGETSGNTLVLGVPSTTGPLPIREKKAELPEATGPGEPESAD